MKFFKRAVCLMLAILLLGLSTAGAAPVKAAGGGFVDMGDVIQLGDWDAPSLHIVFYPKALEHSNQTWPVIVWANGTCCARPLSSPV